MTKPFEIPKALIWKAFQQVRSKGGTAGIDQESIEAFERNLSNNLYKIWNRMVSGSYFPPPVKAVSIPKKDGNTLSVSKVIKGPPSPIIEGPARYPFPLPVDARAKREAETASGHRASW